MRHYLPSRFIATLAVVAVALTGFAATPVAAKDDRTARTLATILGLAIVGKIIHDERKDKKRAKRKKYKPQVQSRTRRELHRHGNLTHSHDDGGYYHQHGYTRNQPEARPLPRRVDRKLLPKECFRSYETRNGRAHMFARRCLERNYRFVDRMPQSCAQRVRTPDGPRRGYDARCLRRNGYSLARS